MLGICSKERETGGVMKKHFATLFCALLPVLAFAQTDQTGATQRPDIDELLTVMRIQKLSEAALNQTRAMMAKIFERAGTSADAEDKAFAFILGEMSWDKMKGEYAKIYAEVLSPEEVKGLIDFYKSPTGQTFLDKQPLLMQKSMAMSQQKMIELMPRLQEMIKKEMPSPVPH